MKKTRNSFLLENSYQAFNPNAQMPYQNASNYFYEGPMPNNYNTNMTLNGSTELESRLAKIERQINRLDYRMSKLENTNNTITNDEYEINNSNMYML